MPIELDLHAVGATVRFLDRFGDYQLFDQCATSSRGGFAASSCGIRGSRPRANGGVSPDQRCVARKRSMNGRKLNSELLRLQQQIGRVERFATLGRITATVAHDLGTPLNSVLGYAQLLAQEDLPERARRRLTIIETQIHRMGEIIQNYLSFSHGNPPAGQDRYQ